MRKSNRVLIFMVVMIIAVTIFAVVAISTTSAEGQQEKELRMGDTPFDVISNPRGGYVLERLTVFRYKNKEFILFFDGNNSCMVQVQ